MDHVRNDIDIFRRPGDPRGMRVFYESRFFPGKVVVRK
jgi:hypothetical protein